MIVSPNRPDPRAVEQACNAALSLIGFRFKYGMGGMALDAQFSIWLGLAPGKHPDFVRMNPNVGLIYHPAMALVAKAANERYRPGAYPTVALALGEICPEVLQFIFRGAGDIVSEASRLAKTIERSALPYLKERANLKSLVPMLEKAAPSLGGKPPLYAACLFMDGRRDEAFAYIESHLAWLVPRGLTREVAVMDHLRSELRHGFR